MLALVLKYTTVLCVTTNVEHGKVKHITFLSTEVDECLTDPCDAYAMCTNTIGSFTCECNPGFEGNGFTCTGKYL